MISNQSRGLNKGPGRLSQLDIGLQAFALMYFGSFAAKARKSLMQARYRSGYERDALLAEARMDGELARSWYQTAKESGVAA